MKIESINLENIGCFSEKQIDFDKLTIIYGENRKGKTTLIYALYFALFGLHLNARLSIKDLCKKGKRGGGATIRFRKDEIRYRLRQTTDRLPSLFCEKNGKSEEISLNDPDSLKKITGILPEIACLTSFFRESELVYFLRDIPRYNQTLLQNFMGMESAFAIKAKFKKALTKAKDYKKTISEKGHDKTPDLMSIELVKRQLKEAEKKFRQADLEYKNALKSKPEDETVLRLLKQQYDEKQKSLGAIKKLKENFPPRAELEEKIKALTGKISGGKQNPDKISELQRLLGSQAQKTQNFRLRLEKLKPLEKKPRCPVCEQSISPGRLKELTHRLENLLAESIKKEKELEENIKKALALEKEREKSVKSLDQAKATLEEINKLDMQIKELTRQTEEFESGMAIYPAKNFDMLKEDEKLYGEAQSPEIRRARVQEEIVNCKVILRQYEDQIKKADEMKKNLTAADRDILVCGAALETMDEAIAGLNRKMLAMMRDSVKKWFGRFEFLKRFEIEMGEKELLPVIQAKGYIYKLNQMSKSERIFLYLMLKLAMGDSLGHLGAFILDDPADGLDEKRKKTLAYLLSRVAEKRQVIITTNDPYFAGLFSGAFRVDL